jgi:hypothetical protein
MATGTQGLPPPTLQPDQDPKCTGSDRPHASQTHLYLQNTSSYFAGAAGLVSDSISIVFISRLISLCSRPLWDVHLISHSLFSSQRPWVKTLI